MKVRPFVLVAASTPFAVSVLLMVAMLTGSMAMLYQYSALSLQRWAHREAAIDNVQSAAAWYMATSGAVPGNIRGVLFHSLSDSFAVKAEPWGIYGLLAIRAKHASAEAAGACLIGTMRQDLRNTALYLVDKQMPLKISGNTRLKGTCFLPPSGVSAGYVGRDGFSGTLFVQGDTKKSTNRMRMVMPFMADSLWRSLHSMREGEMQPVFLKPGDTLIQPWDGQTALWNESGTITLDNITLKGRIRVVSETAIMVAATAVLEDVVLVAPSITIEAGTTARIQAVARDSLLVGKHTVLRYPSSLVLCNEAAWGGRLILEDSARLEGTLLVQSARGVQVTYEPYVAVRQGAEVAGLVCVDGLTELRGTVRGTVLTQGFFLNEGGTQYTNYLYNATIDVSLRSPTFQAGLCLAAPGGTNGLIRWVSW